MLGNLILTLLLLALAYFLLTRKSSTSTPRTSTLIIYGLPDSGKTDLFYRLAHNKQVPTTASMEINRASLQLPTHSLELIDVPGNPSFSLELKKAITPGAALFFLIDCGRA